MRDRHPTRESEWGDCNFKTDKPKPQLHHVQTGLMKERILEASRQCLNCSERLPTVSL